MKRLSRIGGPSAALKAETDEQPRRAAAQALKELGSAELDVRGGSDDLLAAAVLCRTAGTLALPYPVAEELLAIDGNRFVLVSPELPRIDHGDLPGPWRAADLDRRTFDVQPSARTSAKLGPFLVPAALTARDELAAQADIDLALILGSWRILGAVQQSLKIANDHAKARVQFGKPLSEFQAVRFALADAAVAVRGLDELAKYTVSRIASASAHVRSADAVVLRLKAVETAVQILRTSHQVLGALGFCDECDLSVIDRHVQPLLRLPVGAEQLAVRLLPAIREGHLETLFSEPREFG
ncbi:acyl-CoA dehydrogenase [Mycolicibacter heraklionensis]|uniref:Acyl-CoA dehydrogenase n=2 Tax=Mycolicibacter heraklionensis TaxID=512402 RepID=A0ABR5FFF9_9MYCO|nr:acyl-CoA dehydrogenase [Mycolicibacter heraklionensis]